jgi:hypothetical protein
VTVDLTKDTALAVQANRIVNTGGPSMPANFENVIGGVGPDRITGNAANNTLTGNGGESWVERT